MICPHCNKNIDFKATYKFEYFENTVHKLKRSIQGYKCEFCKSVIVFNVSSQYNYHEKKYIDKKELIFPKHIKKILSREIPENYKEEYLEAYSILELSPKSSATLCRRLLQTILHNEFNIQKANLQQEILEFLKTPDIPTILFETIDKIRIIGNWAAHPKKYENTNEIVDVERDEATFLLEIIEELFDYKFVKPKLIKERIDKLNSKIHEIKK